MKSPARDIDHLTLMLPDLGAAAAKLQQLGFNLTPEESDPRVICFQPAEDDIPNYLELTESETEGVVTVLNVAELDGEERSIGWENEDGDKVEATLIVGAGGGPLPWVACRHETPDAFTEPEWIVHANGALGMMAVHAVADDPSAVAHALAKTWKAEVEVIFEGCAVVKTGAVELLVWSPTAYQAEYRDIEAMAPKRRPSIAGIAVAVERARPLQALLRANNVPFAITEGDRVLVAPEQTGGLLIEFMPQT
jgi:hypothetical protein